MARNFNKSNKSDIKFEIVRKIGVLSTSSGGWNKELNLVSWNDNDPKFDIREWSPDHSKMSKGITLTKNEVVLLSKFIQQEGED
jgi:hypothetical protein